MKSKPTPLPQILPNANNPRTISEDMLEKLIDSILAFPQMLELRPIVTDGHGLILGGNMRYKALATIAEMHVYEQQMHLQRAFESHGISEEEQTKLADYWRDWRENPTAPTVQAADLTPQERDALVIKDNVNFGTWDYDLLGNLDQSQLSAWGLHTWEGMKPMTIDTPTDNTPEPQVERDPRERIFILYTDAEADRLQAMLGVDLTKTAYTLDELTQTEEDEPCAE